MTGSSSLSPPQKKKKISMVTSSSTSVRTQTETSSVSIGTQTDNTIIDVEQVDLGTLTPNRLQRLAYSIGQSQHDALRQDSIDLSRHRDIETLKNLSTTTYMNERNSVMQTLLLGVNNHPSLSIDETSEIDKTVV